MDIERYNSLLKDNNVPKDDNYTGFKLKSESEKVIVILNFKHDGYENSNYVKNFHPRVILEPIAIENFNFKNEVKNYRSIKNESLVMVNAHEQVYALTYRLKIDETNRKVSLKIEDMPEMNKIVSDKEKKGIEESY